MPTRLAALVLFLGSCASVPVASPEVSGPEESFEHCKESRDAEVCLRHGLSVVEQNPRMGGILLLAACQLGSDDGCSRADSTLGPFCENGEVGFCRMLWDIFAFSGREERGAYFAWRGCVQNSRDSCYVLASAFETGHGIERDVARAVQLYDFLCDGGHAGSCNNLGLMYRLGSGVEQDFVRSYERYMKACVLGGGLGCANAGQRLITGIGVRQDVARGLAMLEEACRADVANGCYELGIAYLHREREGVERDVDKGQAAFQAACDLGEGRGCSRLALSLRQSSSPDLERIDRLLERAIQILERDCELKSGLSCHELAFLYRTGFGVEVDLERANTLQIRACSLDNRFSECI